MFNINDSIREDILDICISLIDEFKFVRIGGLNELPINKTDDDIYILLFKDNYTSTNQLNYYLPIGLNNSFDSFSLEKSNLIYLEHDYCYYKNLYKKYNDLYNALLKDKDVLYKLKWELKLLSNVLNCCKQSLYYQEKFNVIKHSDNSNKDIFRLFLEEWIKVNKVDYECSYFASYLKSLGTMQDLTVDNILNLPISKFPIVKYKIKYYVLGIQEAYDGKFNSQDLINFMDSMCGYSSLNNNLCKKIKLISNS